MLAITRNGIAIGQNLKRQFADFQVFAPQKLADDATSDITWYDTTTTQKIVELFKSNDALICLFSLGAVIRLIAPHLRDKKTDPAVIVIDDKTNFVISVLSGHIGGANKLTDDIAAKLGAMPVITTAADVNKTIPVDLVGREFGWIIDDDTHVTAVSADMVNEEPIGVYQDVGRTDWHAGELPKNVTVYDSIDSLRDSGSKSCLIISDRVLEVDTKKAVVYRPKSLVIGIGLHHDTDKDTIKDGIKVCLRRFELSPRCVAKLVSIKKPKDVQGLIDAGREMGIPVEYVEREDLAEIAAPNPSDTVMAFEGTASVSEAAAIKVSGGTLIVEKQKFPPNLTIAIARMDKV